MLCGAPGTNRTAQWSRLASATRAAAGARTHSPMPFSRVGCFRVPGTRRITKAHIERLCGARRMARTEQGGAGGGGATRYPLGGLAGRRERAGVEKALRTLIGVLLVLTCTSSCAMCVCASIHSLYPPIPLPLSFSAPRPQPHPDFFYF